MSSRALPRYIRPIFNKLTQGSLWPLFLDASGLHLPGISLLTSTPTSAAETGPTWELIGAEGYQLDSWNPQTGEAYSSNSSGEIKALSPSPAHTPTIGHGYVMGLPAGAWLWKLEAADVADSLKAFLLAAAKKYSAGDLLAGIRWVADPAHRGKIRLLSSDQYRVHEIVVSASWAQDFEGGTGWLHPAMSLALGRKELLHLMVYPEHVAVAAFSSNPSKHVEHLVADNSHMFQEAATPLIENVLPSSAAAGIGGEVSELLAVLDELQAHHKGKGARGPRIWLETPESGPVAGLGADTDKNLPLLGASGNIQLQMFNGTYLQEALAPFAGGRFYLGQGEDSYKAAILTVASAPVRACIMPIRIAGRSGVGQLGDGALVFDPAGHGPRF